MSKSGGETNSNWFLRALTRIRGNFTKKNASDKNQADLDSLPLELLDAVLSQISEQKVLLRCRLVSTKWNQLICDLLEQRQLSHWTTWSLPHSEIPHLSPRIPQMFTNICLVCVISSEGGGKRCNHGQNSHQNSQSLLYHQPRGPLFNLKTNPFPTKSVAILGTLFEMSHNPSVCKINRDWKTYQFRWHIFFEMYGKFLTSLTLHGVEIQTSNLCSLLISAQNLKALSLHVVAIKMGVDTTKTEEEDLFLPDITISPHLKNLQLLYLPKGVANLILRFCSQQLVNLTIVTKHGFGFPNLNERKFNKLTQLKIYAPAVIEWFGVFWEPEVLPKLKRLSILIDDRNPASRTQLESVASFVTLFSESLVRLRLNVKVEKFVKVWGTCGVICSKLRELSLVKTFEGESLEECAFKQAILDWFPNVKVVKFGQMVNKEFAKGNLRGRSNLVNSNIVCPTCKVEPHGYSLLWDYCLN